MTSQAESIIARNSERLNDGVAAAWDRFWFTPADPKLLGMIRICCGLIVLYVHLIYSFNLHAIFGADGWVDVQSANTLRQEAVHIRQAWSKDEWHCQSHGESSSDPMHRKIASPPEKLQRDCV